MPNTIFYHPQTLLTANLVYLKSQFGGRPGRMGENSAGNAGATVRIGHSPNYSQVGTLPGLQGRFGAESQPASCAAFGAVWTQVTYAAAVTTTARRFVNTGLEIPRPVDPGSCPVFAPDARESSVGRVPYLPFWPGTVWRSVPLI